MNLLGAAGTGYGPLLHECPDPAFLWERRTGDVIGNLLLSETTGYSVDELGGALLGQFVHPDDRAGLDAELRLVLQGESRRSRFRGITKAGEPVLLEFTGIPLPDFTGQAAAVFGVLRGIQRQDRISVTASLDHEWERIEGLLRATIDQIELGVYFLDREFRITFLNAAGARHLRAPAEALLGRPFPELFPEAWTGAFGTGYQRAMRDQEVTRVRAYYAPFGQWFEATAYPTASGLVVDLRDVTEDEERRRRLDETSTRLGAQAALLDAARDAMTVRELDNRVRYWNHGAEALFGWRAEEAVGRSIRDLLFLDGREFDVAAAELLDTGYWMGELTQRRKDGTLILVDCRWQLLRDQEGRPSAIFAVESDISEYRKSEEERYRAQRMESLGTLAGGIAHDLNNVLTPVLMAAQLLGADEPDERRRELLQSVESAAHRGAGLISRVLAFAKGDEGERRAVTVDSVLAELGSFCREAMPKTVVVVLDVPTGLPPVLADRTQILQVLVNLVTNARDAMPDGGRLTIGARAVPNRDGPGSGHSVILSVRDTGTGMESSMASRIFEPFFSTKEPGRGTGLGLSTSAAIVKSHGGRIDVESIAGAGSCFAVHLPATTAVADIPDPAAPLPAAPLGSGELVLVVDDEEAVRHSICGVLHTHGYRTVEAADGREALLAAEDPEIRLVIVDLMMPILGGADVMDALLLQRPGTPVIAVSGFDADGRGEAAARAGTARFLAKPFSTSSLLAAVAESLAGVPVP